ncbi:MAG: methyltransferase domain-containing protein [Cyclobacteriaceae bacterium]|nr:methyltransferase domain-containing protein [Cyclobacteriaceae bacterium]
MPSSILTKIRNLKIYKKISAIPRMVSGQYKFYISPSLLFLLQHKEGKLNRYSLIVRYLAIEHLQGKNSIGLNLYNRMQAARENYLKENGIAIRKEDRVDEKQNTLSPLIKSFSTKGFDKNFPIIVNTGFHLIDGSHRLACALYFNIDKVLIKRITQPEAYYGLDWFRNIFNEEEIALLETTYKELIERIDIRSVMKEVLNMEQQTFGRGTFYQSFEELNVSGQRPSAERLAVYNLTNFLAPHQEVLDIGSNCGFITLKTAPHVKHITGIEISSSLVMLSRITQAYLGIHNATFITGSFSKKIPEKKFDFIFSFAVHYWIGLEFKIYIQTLKNLLNPGGLILFESQDIEKMDKDWDEKINQFKLHEFTELHTGSLKDDGVITRKFSVLKLKD